MKPNLYVLAAVTVAALVACSSSDPAADPCAGKGTLSGTDACGKISAAVDAKCSGQTFTYDCAKFVEPCAITNSFCKDGLDDAASKIAAAADCNAALGVTVKLTCF
ncbi:MAG: hypothetical protein KC657_14685 [Myxococcales bacterium]|nr:hypothetical protein [Myxococcales bacterium]